MAAFDSLNGESVGESLQNLSKTSQMAVLILFII